MARLAVLVFSRSAELDVTGHALDVYGGLDDATGRRWHQRSGANWLVHAPPAISDRRRSCPSRRRERWRFVLDRLRCRRLSSTHDRTVGTEATLSRGLRRKLQQSAPACLSIQRAAYGRSTVSGLHMSSTRMERVQSGTLVARAELGFGSVVIRSCRRVTPAAVSDA